MKEMMKPVHSMEEFKKISSAKPSVFVFSADWCPDCRFIEPFLPQLMEKYSQYNYFIIDRDECLDICQELNVLGIPSFVAYKDGVEIARFVSRFRKTQSEIDAFLATLENGKGE